MGVIELSPPLQRFVPQETVELLAKPAPGWEFAGWNGDVSGQDVRASLLMDANKSVQAIFILPYASWITEHFPGETQPSIAGELADPDAVSLANWMEYLLGSDPNHHSDENALRLVVVNRSAAVFHFTRNTGVPSGRVALEVSENLTDWDGPDLEQRVVRIEEGVETIETRVPTGGAGRRFVRLTLSLNDG